MPALRRAVPGAGLLLLLAVVGCSGPRAVPLDEADQQIFTEARHVAEVTRAYQERQGTWPSQTRLQRTLQEQERLLLGAGPLRALALRHLGALPNGDLRVGLHTPRRVLVGTSGGTPVYVRPVQMEMIVYPAPARGQHIAVLRVWPAGASSPHTIKIRGRQGVEARLAGRR